MAKAIASYFATVGMDVDPKAIAKVDDLLNKVRQRMEKFQAKLNEQQALKFTGHLRYRETRTAINTQLAKIGEKLVLPIKNVKIVGKDAKAGIQGSLSKTAFNIRVNGKLSRESILYMKSQLHSAFASTTFDVKTRTTIPNRMPSRSGGGNDGWGGWVKNLFGQSGGSGGSGSKFGGGMLSSLGSIAGGSKWGRFLGPAGMAFGAGASALGSIPSLATSLFTAPFKAIGAVLDATSNSLMRAGARAIPIIGGAYGLGQVNQANDTYQSQRMASDAIFSSGNYGVSGKEAREWLFAAAMRDGFSYKDSMPQFNGFMASAMPLMGFEKSRDTFEAFTQFGRTRGATNDSMGRALYALQQMAGKGQIMSEELNQQMAEAQGFAEAKGIFAEAYQMFLANGGEPKLTGEKAISALGEAMKKGKVKASDIFPFVTQIMKTRSASGIDDARSLASSEQARFMNQRQMFLQRFSDNGGEEGFRTFWKTMADGMTRIQEMAPQIGAWFKVGAEAVDALFATIREVSDFIQTGEMNSIASWMQENGFDVVQLRTDIIALYDDVKAKFTELFGDGSIMDRAKAVLKAVFDSGLLKEYMTHLQLTAKIALSLAAATQAIFSGNFSEAFGHLKDAASAKVDQLRNQMSMGGSMLEVGRAAMEGPEYQSKRERNYREDKELFERSPLAMYDRLGSVQRGGLGFEEWKAAKAAELAQTERNMALRNKGFMFNPDSDSGTGTRPMMPQLNLPINLAGGFGPTTQPPLELGGVARPTGQLTPYTPPTPAVDYGLTSVAPALTDVATSLQNQKMSHKIELRLNMNVDVKTDESQLGLKIADSVRGQVSDALGQHLESTLASLSNY